MVLLLGRTGVHLNGLGVQPGAVPLSGARAMMAQFVGALVDRPVVGQFELREQVSWTEHANGATIGGMGRGYWYDRDHGWYRKDGRPMRPRDWRRLRRAERRTNPRYESTERPAQFPAELWRFPPVPERGQEPRWTPPPRRPPGDGPPPSGDREPRKPLGPRPSMGASAPEPDSD